MILFFESRTKNILAVGTEGRLPENEIEKLIWLFGDAHFHVSDEIKGTFVGPRKEMVTPWSTNAVEITQNMGIKGIIRIEEFHAVSALDPHHDKMLQSVYNKLSQDIFTIDKLPDPVIFIDNIEEYRTKTYRQ